MHSLKHRYRGLVCKIVPLVFLVNLIPGFSQAATPEERQEIRRLTSHEKLIELIETGEDSDIVELAKMRLKRLGPTNKDDFDLLVRVVIRKSKASKAAYRALAEGRLSDPEWRLMKDYRRLLRDNNPNLRRAGLWYMTHAKDKRSFKRLCEMLKDPETDALASTALAALGDPRAISKMIEVGSERALLGVGVFPGAARALVEAIEKMPQDSKVHMKRRMDLTTSLATINNREEKEYLLSQRNHHRDDIKRAVWNSLSSMADESILDSLYEAAISQDMGRSSNAVHGLARSGEKGLALLNRILVEHPKLDPDLRKRVIILFGYYGNESHITILRKIAEQDPDKEARDGAKRAIERIGQRIKKSEKKARGIR